MTHIREFLSRAVASVAAVVYQQGVRLYRLSDWLDGIPDENDLTDEEIVAMWDECEPTNTTTNASVRFHYNLGPR